MHPFPRSHALSSTLLLLCLLATGCLQAVKSLGEISRLRAAIIKEYGEKDVGVNLNNDSRLTITFINSALNEQGPRERALRAQQTAVFVKQHYLAINRIDVIWVGFLRQKTRYVVWHDFEGLGFFRFDKNGRPLPERKTYPPVDEQANSMRPTAVYSSALKQTDVGINSLQLEGDINNGLSVMPHFTVPGDVTGIKRSASFPESVRFDFTSSSEKSMFPGAPTIAFLVDRKMVLETQEQFSTSKFGERFSESVSLGIPYKTFLRMISGKTLTLRIGDREYEFTGDQLEALREMTRYVRD
jgi:hypothetical protein